MLGESCMKLFYKLFHYLNRKDCLKNSFWFYNVLVCGKCKRNIAYYSCYSKHNIYYKDLVIKEPYKKFITHKEVENGL